MIKLLLTRFWIVLIPLILYFAWMAYARRRARKAGDVEPGLLEGPWVTTALITLGLVIASFLWLGLSYDELEGTYIPTHLSNGEVVPARVEPK